MANIAHIDRKRLATTDERHPTKKSPPKPRAKRKRTSAAAEAPKAAPPKRRRTPRAESHACRPRDHSRCAERRKCGARRAKNSLAASHSDAGDCHPTDGSAAFRERFQTFPTSRGTDAARPPRRRRGD